MLLSRVADSLYWISRYLERAEHTARLIDVAIDHGLGRTSPEDGTAIERLYQSIGLDQPGHPAALAGVALFDLSNRSSVAACVTTARENARQVREEISSEMWQQLNELYLRVKQMREEGSWGARTHFASRSVIEGVHLFQGVTDSTMTHGEGWQFIQAGRYLERAVAVSTLVGAHFHEFHQPAQAGAERVYLEWIGLLRSCTAFEAYCKAYTADVKPERIAEFLVLHPSFPHSIRFSAEALETAIVKIGREAGSRRAAHVERIAGRLRATLGFSQIDEIMAGGLQAYLHELLRQCGHVHSALYQTYISYPIEAALEA